MSKKVIEGSGEKNYALDLSSLNVKLLNRETSIIAPA
jgi:hypothetical protein